MRKCHRVKIDESSPSKQNLSYILNQFNTQVVYVTGTGSVRTGRYTLNMLRKTNFYLKILNGIWLKLFLKLFLLASIIFNFVSFGDLQILSPNSKSSLIPKNIL